MAKQIELDKFMEKDIEIFLVCCAWRKDYSQMYYLINLKAEINKRKLLK